jgi:hypothetical protein
MNVWTFVRCAESHNNDQVQTPVIVVNGGFPPALLGGGATSARGDLQKRGEAHILGARPDGWASDARRIASLIMPLPTSGTLSGAW